MRFYALACLHAIAVAALDWVEVDATGAAVATHTAAAPPSYLTTTATYVLLLPTDTTTTTADDDALLATATATATSTGRAPVASATGAGRAGAFLACGKGSGGSSTTDRAARDVVPPEDGASPFCQPVDGAQLQPGGTYYITWDPTALPNTTTTAAVAATYASGDSVSADIDPAAGYYAWNVPDDLLNNESQSHRMAVAWSLVYEVPTGAGRTHRSVLLGGPVVVVTDRVVTPGKKKVNAAAIAVPVVVGGGFVVAALAACVCTYRHKGRLPLVGGLVARRTSSFSAKGYRGSSGGGSFSGAGVSSPRPVFDLERGVLPSRPLTGVNVFREELKRQAEERRDGGWK